MNVPALALPPPDSRSLRKLGAARIGVPVRAADGLWTWSCNASNFSHTLRRYCLRSGQDFDARHTDAG